MTIAPTAALPNDQQKEQIWAAYRTRRPTRVPVVFWTNPRVVVSNRQWNPEGVTYQQYWHDPAIHLEMVLRHELFRHRVLNRHSDGPTELPEVWRVTQVLFNVYEAAQLGATVHFPGEQIPCTEPVLFSDADFEAFYALDIEHPLDHGFLHERMKFQHELERVAKDYRFEGRPVEVTPWHQCGTDGPVTVGCNLCGTDFLVDLISDPDRSDRMMARIVEAAMHRRRAFQQYWGSRLPMGEGIGIADDSIALLSTEMYRERVLPLHRRWLDQAPGPRGIHLCGDSTRHFVTIHRELNVTSFDTGFPVDFKRLRQDLGPDVEILGGPHADLFVYGTPEQLYQRSVEILRSGIMQGGRFTLREGNNLPPNVPEENLAAVYQAALDHGHYPG